MSTYNAQRRRQNTIRTCEAVEEAILQLQSDRIVFSRFAEAVRESAEVQETPFPHAVASWYAQSVLLGLRRIGDCDSRSHSLRALLDRMIETPKEWTLDAVREFWIVPFHHYDLDMLEFLAKSTYKFCADDTGCALDVALDVARVARDVAALDAALAKAKHIVDRTIAHRDSRGAGDVSMTYDQMDDENPHVRRNRKALHFAADRPRLL